MQTEETWEPLICGERFGSEMLLEFSVFKSPVSFATHSNIKLKATFFLLSYCLQPSNCTTNDQMQE